MDDLANTGGRVLGGLLAADEVRRGGLLSYLSNRSALLQDPGLRGSLSPFTSGLLEVGGRQVPQSGAGEPQMAGLTPEQAGQMGVQMLGPSQTFGGAPPPTGSRFVPNLPPLAPEADFQNRLAQTMTSMMASATPAQQQQIAMHKLGVQPTPEQELAQYAPYMPKGGMRLSRFTSGPATFAAAPPEEPDFVPVPGNPRLLYSPRTGRTATVPAPPGAGAEAGARAKADLQAQALGFRDAHDPAYVKAMREAAGIDQSPGVQPPPVPQPPPQLGQGPPPAGAAAPSPAPSPLEAIPDDTPVSQLPFAGSGGRVGFPSPAFAGEPSDVVQTPQGNMNVPTWATQLAQQGGGAQGSAPVPMPANAPPQTPQAANIPAGERRTFRMGPFTRTQTGPPAPGKAVPAITARGLAGETTARSAALDAIQIIKAGPQHPLSIYGMSTGITPPAFAGPASGRFLGGLQTISGQPVAVEESQLDAKLAHARTGIFGIIGLRPNKETLAMFDPLMPNLHQPTEILLAHLERLATFYDMLATQQAALSNLSDAQKASTLYDMFKSHMGTPTAGNPIPPVIDLRPAAPR